MRNIHLMLVLTISLLPFAAAQAAPADLPQTGQTTCTDTTGATIACANTGQDGDTGAGATWPSPRFTVNSGGYCVTDNLTDLMWAQNPDATARTWQQALDFANNLELCGATDWRIPNINELESLVNIEVADQASFLNSQGFSNVQADSYWSSSIYVGCCSSSAFLAWAVFMVRGDVGPIDRSVSRYVLPVRSRQ